jgi:hypothetical protein
MLVRAAPPVAESLDGLEALAADTDVPGVSLLIGPATGDTEAIDSLFVVGAF